MSNRCYFGAESGSRKIQLYVGFALVAVVAFVLGVAWPREVNRAHQAPVVTVVHQMYVVQPGDTPWRIGRKFVAPSRDLRPWLAEMDRLNSGLPKNRQFWPGDRLLLPAGSVLQVTVAGKESP